MTELSLDEARKDRIRGAILGAACGNSLGGSCIGLNHKEILGTTGLSVLRDFVPGLTRSQLPDHKPGRVLADFILGESIAWALIENHGQLNETILRSSFKDLLEDKSFLASGPGAHCLASLRRFVDQLPSTGDRLETTHVSGAARAFILGCLPNENGGSSREELAIMQAEATHNNKSVAAASAVISGSIAALIEGIQLDSEEDVRNYVQKQLESARKIDKRFADFWDDVAPDLDYSKPATDIPYSLVNVEPTVFECVPSSVGLFLIFRHDPEEAICQSAKIGGDTDTAALIVGALAGAYHGASKLPKRWLDSLEDREAIEQVANGMISLWKS